MEAQDMGDMLPRQGYCGSNFIRKQMYRYQFFAGNFCVHITRSHDSLTLPRIRNRRPCTKTVFRYKNHAWPNCTHPDGIKNTHESIFILYYIFY
jgi:hypothetical protein